MGLTGVLALQGCIEPHLQILRKLEAPALAVRTKEELAKVERLIMPGGESSTMLRLLERSGLFAPLQEFGRTRPVWGVCAGAILIASQVVHPEQQSLALMDIRATRNFYGCQLNSFKSKVAIKKLRIEPEVDFIRAPLLEPLAKHVEVLAKHKGRAVLLRQGRLLASSFHIELTDETDLHQHFLEF